MKKWKCNISGLFCLICLKLCRLLELSKGISLDFKFHCYGNQNQNDCLLVKKQRIYCLSWSDVQKVIWNNTVWLLLQAVSNFEEKLVIHSSYCEKTIVFCFWTKPNYSRLSSHSNKIWNQVEFLCSLLTACKISNKSNQRLLRSCTFIFSMSCSIASVTSYLSENEIKNLQNGDVHLAEIPDFEMGHLENHLANWGQWWLIFLHFSRSFIWAKLFFSQSFPLNMHNFQMLLKTTLFKITKPNFVRWFPNLARIWGKWFFGREGQV